MTRWQLQRAFPEQALAAITASVRTSEQRHGGEIRVAIEADLSVSRLLRRQTSRARALEVFAKLGVWDTQARNGVLIYLCLADRVVEIIADRGLHTKVSDDEWAVVCAQLQTACSSGKYQQGMCDAVIAVGPLLAMHFPISDRNEQSDHPVLL
jgi:uncharacterized membrane protein